MNNFINVNYEVKSLYKEIKDSLENIPSKLISCDFEAFNKYTDKQIDIMKNRLPKATIQYKKTLLQRINATGLSHPSLVNITHFQYSYTEDTSTVIVITNKKIRELVYNFLVTTPIKQVWHNAGFDFKHIYHNTSKLPKDYEDTQLLAKCYLNNANEFLGKTGLKDLMGYAYNPKWKELSDNFKSKDLFDKDFIEYAAIDSAATYKLWQDIQYNKGE